MIYYCTNELLLLNSLAAANIPKHTHVHSHTHIPCIRDGKQANTPTANSKNVFERVCVYILSCLSLSCHYAQTTNIASAVSFLHHHHTIIVNAV